MCGICGVIGIESRDASEAATRRMMGAMIHRGPDEDGILLAPPVAIGMRRLSIIDLPGGTQPVWNETGTVAVLFNGEIYNFARAPQGTRSAGPPVSARIPIPRRSSMRMRHGASAASSGCSGCSLLPSSKCPAAAAVEPRAYFWRATGSASSLSTTRAWTERCFSPPKFARCWRAAAFRRGSRPRLCRRICCSALSASRLL